MTTRKKPLDTILDGHEFAFYMGRRFRGLSITENGSGWNIIIRSWSLAGQAEYARGHHENPQEGLKALLNALASKGGERLWHHDKFYASGG
jgi:hypothetical protein